MAIPNFAPFLKNVTLTNDDRLLQISREGKKLTFFAVDTVMTFPSQTETRFFAHCIGVLFFGVQQGRKRSLTLDQQW